MSQKCYITGAGTHYYNDNFIPDDDDFVIAADGGYIFNSLHNIRTNLVIGDFDSLEDGDVSEDIEVIKLNPVKDETDILSAVDEGIKKGFREFHIFGGTGGRTEHTFANIQVLNYLAVKDMQGFLYSESEIMTVIRNRSITFGPKMTGYISAFAFDSECSGVTETGLKYEIDNYTMKNSFPIGVSNEFTGKESTVSVKKGSLLVIYPR
ncbi:MAG: thiamine diphosphokinase [Oscillospiraceae bacterium]|nr:thiamine diphosphokinase [Oscillospiraceae bacterium]